MKIDEFGVRTSQNGAGAFCRLKYPHVCPLSRYPDPQHLPQPCGEGAARVHLKQHILRGYHGAMSKLPVSSFF